MVGAVIVGAVRRENRQSVGVIVGANEMIGSRFTCRIRAIGLVLLGLGEGGIRGRKRSIDLVGRHVKKSERLLGGLIEAAPVGTCRLQEGEGADDVGLNELGRPMDGAIHMRLRGKVDNRAGPMLGEDLGDKFGITDITPDEGVTEIPIKRCKVLEVPCVGELIQVDDGVFLKIYPVDNEIRTDKTGTAGNED